MPNILIILLYISLFLSFYVGFLFGQLVQIAKQGRRYLPSIEKVLALNQSAREFKLPPDELEWRKLLEKKQKY